MQRLLLIIGFVLIPSIGRGEPVTIIERETDQRIFSLSSKLTLSGKVETPLPENKKASLRLKGSGSFLYRERRFPGEGEGPQAIRSVRRYEKGSAEVTVAEQVNRPALRVGRYFIQAEGSPTGMKFASPEGPLRYQEIECLDTGGDSSLCWALLPESQVEEGDTWKPAVWVPGFITGIESVEKSDLECKIKSLDAKTAVISFQGKISGAIRGTRTSIELSGELTFDRENRHWTACQIERKEQRQIGPIDPGLMVTAVIELKRTLAEDEAGFEEKVLSALPEKMESKDLLLEWGVARWGVRALHSREWHMFHQTPDMAIFRLMKEGSLVAQCNIRTLPQMKPGEHVDTKVFERDIRKAIGDQYQSTVEATEIPLKEGTFGYRVTVLGNSPKMTKDAVEQIPMIWIYYLLAGPDGQQVVLLFSVEASLVEKMHPHDTQFSAQLEFTPVDRLK